MDFHPVSFDGGRQSSRQIARADQARQAGELQIFQHGVDAGVLGAFDQIDTQTTADAVEYALGEEINLLERGVLRAGNSRAALELVLRKVQLFTLINDGRLTRRFGR